MLRRDDWLMAYHEAMRKHSATPFTWGEHDCAILAADVIEAVTGRDLAEAFRGKYDSAESAKAIMRQHKIRSPISIVAKAFKKIPIAQAQVGDIAVIKTADGPALAPVIGSELAVFRPGGLLGYCDRMLATHAYRVELATPAYRIEDT
jgi:hypothetical protein